MFIFILLNRKGFYWIYYEEILTTYYAFTVPITGMKDPKIEQNIITPGKIYPKLSKLKKFIQLRNPMLSRLISILSAAKKID